MKSDLIRSVFLDELERHKRMILRYEKETESLPKGSVFKRKIGNQEYLYLNYRDGKKVYSKFLGKPGNFDLQDLQEKLNRRKELSALLKKMNKELKELEKEVK
ncbi:hypothetical protein [Treponema sp.]|uniref:hypothetical protein n=1 Tax=Treponema sp. TaxID=166 RepID=UPI003F0BBA92